jgi:hypothetical protein
MTPLEHKQEIENLRSDFRSLLEDPMTSAMGAPIGDFAEERDREIRHHLTAIVNEGEGRIREWALNEMEVFCL